MFQAWNLVIGYYLMKDMDGFPKELGGSGDFSNILRGLPAWDKPQFFDFYFCSFFGFFVEDTIEIIIRY